MLRFHEELYDGFAVDEAAKVYADHAETELVREQGGYVVKVTARPETLAQGIDEATLCLELSNYALGKTIDMKSAVAASIERRAPVDAGGAAA